MFCNPLIFQLTNLCSIRSWFSKTAYNSEQPWWDPLLWLPSILGFHALNMACTGKWSEWTQSGISRQLYSVPLRTVQQLKGTNARNTKIYAPCMQPEILFQGNLPCSFYLLSSSSHHSLAFLLFGEQHLTQEDTETPAVLATPTARSFLWTGVHQEEIAACHHTHSSTQLLLLYKLPAVLMESGELFVSLHKC